MCQSMGWGGVAREGSVVVVLMALPSGVGEEGEGCCGKTRAHSKDISWYRNEAKVVMFSCWMM